jgi:tRNA-binding EMAP/Myf-like protein
MGEPALQWCFDRRSNRLQVVAGLKKHISREELKGRLVVCVLNLKPAKLAGELSEAVS